MCQKTSRRSFVATASLGALVTPSLLSLAKAAPQDAAVEAPQALAKRTVKPVVVSSANGNMSKDSEGLTAVAKAFQMITSGRDVLDAVIAGVNIVELDPNQTSVGYGGLPNADGVVQLDASVMHGPLKRAGGVACLEGVRTPSLVAQKVMNDTDHLLLVGKGAQEFARLMGFKIEEHMITDQSRRRWLEWKRRADPAHYLNPKERAEAGERVSRQMMAEGRLDPEHYFGTINCNGVNAKGEICGVTTTSGLAFKIPGRVGDSPIIGAGLYVDGEVGAAGSTGRGEANLYSLCSFLIVEGMRNGMSPKDAGLAALKRVVSQTVEKRLLNSRGRPNFDLKFYVLNVRGEFAGLSLYENGEGNPARFAVCTEQGPQTLHCEALFPGTATD